MKINRVLIIIMTVIVWGCNDSFLDKTPQDQLSDASFWKIEDDAVKFSASIYRYLVTPADYLILSDAFTDNAVPTHIMAAQGQISTGTATSSNGYFLQVWRTAYQGIRRCNILLDNIENVDMDENRRQILIGEAEFLRAFFHATLLKYYGGIPIITHVLELNEIISPRNSADDVYNFIIEECDKAATKLPINRQSNDEIGRATKGAALALKAHVSYLMNDYAVAFKASEEVINLEEYDIFDDYEGLFLADNENNCEVIFDRQYLENAPDNILGSQIDQYFASAEMAGWEAIGPSQDLVDSYECIDGESINESLLYDLANPFENRDPRLAATVLWHGSEIGGVIFNTEGRVGSANSTRTGYSLRKYVNPENVGIKYPGWINFIYLRYAEILLIYAETLNEQNGPVQEVYDAVNKIRQRSTVELPPLEAGMSKEEMKEAIRNERRVEFAFEGLHLFETRSWRTTEADVEKPVYGRLHDGTIIFIEQRDFDPGKNYLWGIPLTEIDLSKNVLTQNLGY